MAVSTLCRDVASELGEELAGSAPHAPRWMLVEHNGPWGRDALMDTGFPADLVGALGGRLAAAGVRFQLVRRHRTRDRGLGTTVMLVSSQPGDEWIRRFRVADAQGLLDVPVDRWDELGALGLGTLVEERVLLVCTHARRDACCAKFGRPLAEVVSSIDSVDAWETSHTGGHRFAPNLVVLPEGYVYGRVDVRAAAGLVQGHVEGRVDVGRLRGRSAYDTWGQAADVAVRRRMGLQRSADVEVLDVTRHGEDEAVVRLVAGRDVVSVSVVRHTAGAPRAVSCGAGPTDPGVFEVGDLVMAAAVR